MTNVSLGDLLSETFEGFKNNYALFFKLLLTIFLAPSMVVVVLFQILYLVFIFGDITSNMWVSIPVFLFLILLAFVSILLYLFMSIALVKTVQFLDKKPKISKVVEISLPYLWKYFLLNVLIFVVAVLLPLSGWTVAIILKNYVILGILFFLTLIYWTVISIYLNFATYALLLDDKGIIESIRYSVSLVKGNWWKVFLYFVIFVFIMMGLGSALAIPLMIIQLLLVIIPFIGPIISSALQLLVTILLAPVGALFWVNFYKKLKEAK